MNFYLVRAVRLMDRRVLDSRYWYAEEKGARHTLGLLATKLELVSSHDVLFSLLT
jgi:hypothetical protein